MKMTDSKNEPRILLVDGVHGYGIWANAARNYELTDIYGKRFKPAIYAELMDRDHDDHFEAVDEITGNVAVEIDGRLWAVEADDGDIFAINPDAQWSVSYDEWQLPVNEDGHVH